MSTKALLGLRAMNQNSLKSRKKPGSEDLMEGGAMWACGVLCRQSKPWGRALGQRQCVTESVQPGLEVSVELYREVKSWRVFSKHVKIIILILGVYLLK